MGFAHVRPVRLRTFSSGNFTRGRSTLVEALWVVVSMSVMRSSLPGSRLRKGLLKAFGAKIGPRVIVKQNVTVKFPWRLTIGADTWIGEGAWIDNLAEVAIGADVCISQGAYICTGSHDWSSPSFDLITSPVVVGDGSWVCAKAVVGPGVTLGAGAVVALGAIATHDVPPMSILRADGKIVKRKFEKIS